MSRLAVRAAAALGLLVVGAATAIAVVALHDLVWGLALGVGATLLTAVALPAGWWSRLAFCLGSVAMLGRLILPRAEGDYLVSKDWQGYAVLGLALTLFILGLATLPRPQRRGSVDAA